MEWIQSQLDHALGLSVEPRDYTLLHLSLRAVVVFAASLLMLRLAHKRFFAGKNAIDVLLTFVLASTLSRAINGSAAFFGTIAVGFLLVILHNVLTWAACRYHGFGQWVKGHPQVVIADGEVKEPVLKKHHVSRKDLEEDLRLNGGTTSTEHVKQAVLERNGDISVIKQPHVVTVAVQQGVQTIRIHLEG